MEQFCGGYSSLGDPSSGRETNFFLATDQAGLWQLWSLTKQEYFNYFEAKPDLSDCPQLPEGKIAVGIVNTFSSSGMDRLKIESAVDSDNGRVVVSWKEAPAGGLATCDIGSPWTIAFIPRCDEVEFVGGEFIGPNVVTLKIESAKNFVAAPAFG